MIGFDLSGDRSLAHSFWNVYRRKPQPCGCRTFWILTPVAAARRLLEAIWRDGYDYQKAGVMLSEFRPARLQGQADLFSSPAEQAGKTALMAVVDRINNSGTGKVWLAAQGEPKGAWAMKRQLLSPAYTTRWSDIPKVR